MGLDLVRGVEAIPHNFPLIVRTYSHMHMQTCMHAYSCIHFFMHIWSKVGTLTSVSVLILKKTKSH